MPWAQLILVRQSLLCSHHSERPQSISFPSASKAHLASTNYQSTDLTHWNLDSIVVLSIDLKNICKVYIYLPNYRISVIHFEGHFRLFTLYIDGFNLLNFFNFQTRPLLKTVLVVLTRFTLYKYFTYYYDIIISSRNSRNTGNISLNSRNNFCCSCLRVW